MAGPLARRPQMTDEVAEELRLRIITGRIRPGAFIRLDETAAEFGCSVTPIREALLTLRGEGLVYSSPHRGFIVEQLARSDFVDIFWMQAELSARLATHAVDNETLGEDLPELTAIVDDLEAAVLAGDAERVRDREFEFHRRVHLAANSKKLAWFLLAANKYVPHALYAHDSEWGREAVASHRRLISYLAVGDTESIRTEIHARFIDARDRLIRQLEAQGFWSALS